MALPEHCVVRLRRQLILTGFLVHKKLCSWFCRAVLPTRLLFSRKLCLSQWRGSKWRVEGHEKYMAARSSAKLGGGAPWLQEKSSSTKVLSLCFLQCTKTRAVRLFHVLMRNGSKKTSFFFSSLKFSYSYGGERAPRRRRLGSLAEACFALFELEIFHSRRYEHKWFFLSWKKYCFRALTDGWLFC